MSTTQKVRPSTPFTSSGPFERAAALVQRVFQRGSAQDGTSDSGDLWQLYRMTRGSDSIRPAVVRKLDAVARRQPA